MAAGYRGRDVPLLTHYDMLGVIHDFRYKLIFHRPLGTYLLFDLREDPGEMTNLADSRPELLGRDALDGCGYCSRSTSRSSAGSNDRGTVCYAAARQVPLSGHPQWSCERVGVRGVCVRAGY